MLVEHADKATYSCSKPTFHVKLPYPNTHSGFGHDEDVLLLLLLLLVSEELITGDFPVWDRKISLSVAVQVSNVQLSPFG